MLGHCLNREGCYKSFARLSVHDGLIACRILRPPVLSGTFAASSYCAVLRKSSSRCVRPGWATTHTPINAIDMLLCAKMWHIHQQGKSIKCSSKVICLNMHASSLVLFAWNPYVPYTRLHTVGHCWLLYVYITIYYAYFDARKLVFHISFINRASVSSI